VIIKKRLRQFLSYYFISYAPSFLNTDQTFKVAGGFLDETLHDKAIAVSRSTVPVKAHETCCSNHEESDSRV
jgi:hypothetical protein